MNVSLPYLRNCKHQGQKFACLTAYDFSIASAVRAAGAHVVLVGDSLGNVVQGRSSTLGVQLDELAYHTRCVAPATQGLLLMADAPLLSTASLDTAVDCARTLLQAGAQCIKYECAGADLPVIKSLIDLDVPVCVHLGLRPQSLPKMGTYKAQGLDASSAGKLLELAKAYDQLGVDCFLLECVGSECAQRISQQVRAPVIGIGAGVHVDGQILVCYDALGMNPKPARFVKNFLAGQESIEAAFASYVSAVQAQSYPAAEHSYYGS